MRRPEMVQVDGMEVISGTNEGIGREVRCWLD